MDRIKIFVIVLAVLALSGCSAADKAGREQKKAAEEDYLPQQVNLYQGMKEDIQKATDQENKKINEALEESGLKDNKNSMDYAKQYSQAVITTSLGKIKVKFYGADSPNTVNNFLKLAAEKFYDGTKFHRVIKGFMIQGGDPNSKTGNIATWGMGGPGYKFADEFNSKKLVRGSLAMANSGPDTNGSQFFIVTAEATPWLDGKHTNFGEVISGMEVVDKIENAKTGANDRPAEDIIIQGIELVK